MALIDKKQTQPVKPLSMMVSMKDGHFDDFIGVWKKFVPDYFCEELIDKFDEIENEWDALGFKQQEISEEYAVWDGTAQFSSNKNLGRDDKQILLNYADSKRTYGVNQYLTACFNDYCRTYGQLQNIHMMNPDIKMQKTEEGGGYHQWHYESGAFDMKNRELVWMIYLNDLDDDAGGETEFLYQKRRIKPEKGTLVIFPAGLTHVHKGNTVLSGTKYILTGWFIQVA